MVAPVEDADALLEATGDRRASARDELAHDLHRRRVEVIRGDARRRRFELLGKALRKKTDDRTLVLEAEEPQRLLPAAGQRRDRRVRQAVERQADLVSVLCGLPLREIDLLRVGQRLRGHQDSGAYTVVVGVALLELEEVTARGLVGPMEDVEDHR